MYSEDNFIFVVGRPPLREFFISLSPGRKWSWCIAANFGLRSRQGCGHRGRAGTGTVVVGERDRELQIAAVPRGLGACVWLSISFVGFAIQEGRSTNLISDYPSFLSLSCAEKV